MASISGLMGSLNVGPRAATAVNDENATPAPMKVSGDREALSSLRRGRLLGVGGRGETRNVFATCLASRRVALKVYEADGEAARREVAALTAVGATSRVVRCLGAEFTSTASFVALEYCAHGSLCDFLLRKASHCTLADLRAIASGLLAALEVVAAASYAHRDVRPSKLLVTSISRASIPTLKLAGFDESVRVTGPAAGARDASGTEAYRAPEQHVGGGEHGTAVDVWAAAVTLYECARAALPGREGRTVLFEPSPDYPAFDDFLTAMLRPNPNLRATAAAAQAHPFLR